MANLSVWTQGKWIWDTLGNIVFDNILKSEIPTCFGNINLKWLLRPNHQVKKVRILIL